MLALITLIIILGILIFVHEFGHFITSKKFGAHVYEFALGMGPKIFSFKRKNDPTIYSLRLFPVGGYCAIAGEDGENLENEDQSIKKSEYLCNKPKWQRCIILIAGVFNNFVAGFIILFISALIFGSVNPDSYLGDIDKSYPAYIAGMRKGDRIIKIDNHRVSTFDDITLRLVLKHKKKTYEFSVLKPNGKVKTYKIKPVYDKKSNRYIFGINQDNTKLKGIVSSLRYACIKFVVIIKSMFIIIIELIMGNLSLSALSGPIGVYSVTKVAAKTSFESVLYLMAYLSINLGFVNILPFPAFDGGRVFLLIIEKIRGKKLNSKVENAINTIGFALLMILMIVISIKDVINLFV